MSKKRIADSDGKTMETMEDVIAFIETLEQDDLKQLEVVIAKQLRGKPLKMSANPLFDGKLQMFYQGVGGELSDSAEIYADEIHSFLIKWSNGDEMNVRVANQDGVMHAGTTKYEVEYVEIGKLGITGSFPEGSRLPSGVDGINEFADELKKHGITSKADIEKFVAWILDSIDGSRCSLTITYVRYNAEHDVLFGDYCSDNEEEEEECAK
eukprot:gene8371-6041_t